MIVTLGAGVISLIMLSERLCWEWPGRFQARLPHSPDPRPPQHHIRTLVLTVFAMLTIIVYSSSGIADVKRMPVKIAMTLKICSSQ